MTELEDYPFTVRPLAGDDGGGYLCEFPDLPGCIGDGETVEDAIRDGRAALWSCIETLRDLGRPIPAPSRSGGSAWPQGERTGAPSVGRRQSPLPPANAS